MTSKKEESVDYEKEDAFFIQDWEDFCRYCIENGKIDFFKQKLRDYIHALQQSVEAHVRMIYGETVMIPRVNEEKLMKSIKSKKSSQRTTLLDAIDYTRCDECVEEIKRI